MAENYKLPGSSYEEFVKILKAYSTGKVGIPMSLDTVAQTTGMDKTIVSRNNGFLVQLSLISEGNKKSPTQEGIDLGRAYTHKVDDQIVRIWRTLIEKDEFLSRMLSAIKIRNGMEKTSLVNHILYSSGSSNNNSTRAGASTIIEIYKVAGLVQEADGKIIALEDDELVAPEVSSSIAQVTFSSEQNTTIPSTSIQLPQQAIAGGITININIDVSVDEIDTLSEKIRNLIENLKQ